MANKDKPASGYGRCPICGEKVEQAFRPFCSARCRDVDLARWLGGGYVIAGGRAEADEDGDEAGVGGATGSGLHKGEDDDPA